MAFTIDISALDLDKKKVFSRDYDVINGAITSNLETPMQKN